MVQIILALATLLCFTLAGGFLWKAYQERQKQTEEKGFIIIGTLLFLFLGPSAALAILGFVFLFILLKILF